MAECMWLHLNAVMYFLSPGVLLKDLLIDTGFLRERERQNSISHNCGNVVEYCTSFPKSLSKFFLHVL